MGCLELVIAVLLLIGGMIVFYLFMFPLMLFSLYDISQGEAIALLLLIIAILGYGPELVKSVWQEMRKPKEYRWKQGWLEGLGWGPLRFLILTILIFMVAMVFVSLFPSSGFKWPRLFF